MSTRKINNKQLKDLDLIFIKKFINGKYENKFIDVKEFKKIQSTSGSGDKHYTHIQSIPSITWEINHNLNKYPTICVVDSAGSQVEGDVLQLNKNRIIITFSASFSGSAYLN